MSVYHKSNHTDEIDFVLNEWKFLVTRPQAVIILLATPQGRKSTQYIMHYKFVDLCNKSILGL